MTELLHAVSSLSWHDRFASPPQAPDNPSPLEAMAFRLATPEGGRSYGLRKQTFEPVPGIIKSVMGFRQSSMRRHFGMR